jgi:hypothetical protein
MVSTDKRIISHWAELGADNPQAADFDGMVRTYYTLPLEIRAHRGNCIFVLAITLIKFFLGNAWTQRFVLNVRTDKNGDGFFRVDFASQNAEDIKLLRVLDFAEVLFNLQHIRGFHDRLGQMRSGLIESTFAEFECARHLFTHAVPFEFWKAEGVPGGHNYDFIIGYSDGARACADAKCRLDQTEVRPRTITSRLKEARKQIPDGQTGIVFVKLPATWVRTETTRAEIRRVAMDFLGNSNRIASVILYSPIPLQFGDEKITWVVHSHEEYLNPKRLERDWTVFKDRVPLRDGAPESWTRLFSHGGLVYNLPFEKDHV